MSLELKPVPMPQNTPAANAPQRPARQFPVATYAEANPPATATENEAHALVEYKP